MRSIQAPGVMGVLLLCFLAPAAHADNLYNVDGLLTVNSPIKNVSENIDFSFTFDHYTVNQFPPSGIPASRALFESFQFSAVGPLSIYMASSVQGFHTERNWIAFYSDGGKIDLWYNTAITPSTPPNFFADSIYSCGGICVSNFGQLDNEFSFASGPINVSVTPTSTPEPAESGTLLPGLGGLGAISLRRRYQVH
jgi:hypothetical protein